MRVRTRGRTALATARSRRQARCNSEGVVVDVADTGGATGKKDEVKLQVGSIRGRVLTDIMVCRLYAPATLLSPQAGLQLMLSSVREPLGIVVRGLLLTSPKTCKFSQR